MSEDRLKGRPEHDVKLPRPKHDVKLIRPRCDVKLHLSCEDVKMPRHRHDVKLPRLGIFLPSRHLMAFLCCGAVKHLQTHTHFGALNMPTKFQVDRMFGSLHIAD